MDTPPPTDGPPTLPVAPSSLPLDDYTNEINALLRMTAAFRSVLGQLENFALSLAAKSTRPGPPTSTSGAHNSPDPTLRPILGDAEKLLGVNMMEILKQAEESGRNTKRTVRHSRGKPVTETPVQPGEEDHELPATTDE